MEDKKCILAWNHVATKTTGEVRLCCISGQSYIMAQKLSPRDSRRLGSNKIADFFFSEERNLIRQEMSEGKTPESCGVCEYNENLFGDSKRTHENLQWGSQDFSRPLVKYFDLRLGNTCNLACVGCSTRDSSMWEIRAPQLLSQVQNPELKKYISYVQQFPNYKKENQWCQIGSPFWEDFFSYLPHIKSIYFAGGEPLIQKEHDYCLAQIVQRGYAKEIDLRYNTNITTLSESVIEKWRYFKGVEVSVSIDSFGQKNDYVRFGSHWSQVLENISKLTLLPFISSVSISKTIHNYNILYVPEFFEELISHQLLDTSRVDINILYSPRFLSVQSLPAQLKSHIVRKYKAWALYQKHSRQLNKILSFMGAADTSRFFHEFIEYTNALDSSRGTNFKETFPELEALLHEI